MEKLHIRLAGIVLVILVIITGIYLTNKSARKTQPTDSVMSDQQKNQLPENPAIPSLDQHSLEGLLKISDNLKKGNLMIVNETRVTYIYTSRDFSSLLNKQAIMTYQGTLDKFVLGEIVTK